MTELSRTFLKNWIQSSSHRKQFRIFYVIFFLKYWWSFLQCVEKFHFFKIFTTFSIRNNSILTALYQMFEMLKAVQEYIYVDNCQKNLRVFPHNSLYDMPAFQNIGATTAMESCWTKQHILFAFYVMHVYIFR